MWTWHHQTLLVIFTFFATLHMCNEKTDADINRYYKMLSRNKSCKSLYDEYLWHSRVLCRWSKLIFIHICQFVVDPAEWAACFWSGFDTVISEMIKVYTWNINRMDHSKKKKILSGNLILCAVSIFCLLSVHVKLFFHFDALHLSFTVYAFSSENKNKGAVAKLYLKFITYHDLNV